MLSKWMLVKVFAGAVLAAGSWGQTTLCAEEQQMLAAPAGEGNPDMPDAAERLQKFRESQAKEFQKSLGATDDEWKVLRPLIEKVQSLQGQLRSRPMMGGAGTTPMRIVMGGGQPKIITGPGADQPQTELGKKLKELKELADKPDAKPDEIKAKMEEVRKLREQAKADLVAAQGKLKEVVTVKQEAAMIVRGLLE